jgi:hypothetical protein
MKKLEVFLYHISDIVTRLAGYCALVEAIMKLLQNTGCLYIAV